MAIPRGTEGEQGEKPRPEIIPKWKKKQERVSLSNEEKAELV